MLIVNAEIAGRICDLRCTAGRIAEIAEAGASLARREGEARLDAAGGALLPGLHDHHIHLLSLAAAEASVRCGPPQVESRAELIQALRIAPSAQGWIRGAGYFESVAGPLDRDRLDAWCPDVPVRIQHRSGSMWFLNSAAIAALELDGRPDPPEGLERDEAGRVTGRLFRADGWLRRALPASGRPSVAAVGRKLARFGVTGATDATPSNGPEEVAFFRESQRAGALPQRLRVMGRLALSEVASDEFLSIGAHKRLLDEPALPPLDELIESVRRAHAQDRGIALHTVTRSEIHFALAAIEAAGAHPRDRLEHASVAPPESMQHARSLGVGIVTQPNFVVERGDAYRAEVDARDQPHLYRVRSWLDLGVTLRGGTDAPFGHPDPWRAMAAAVSRRTRSGALLGGQERVSPEVAFDLFRAPGARPLAPTATPSARLAPGAPADLCLLDRPWESAREALERVRVIATLRDGELIHEA